MYQIATTFEIAIAHRLSDLPPGHKCGNLHGHNLEVTVVLAATELDDHGFVIEFSELRGLFQEVVADRLDHANVNEALRNELCMDTQPTAERLAEWIAYGLEAKLRAGGAPAYFRELCEFLVRGVHVARVDVQETRHCVASYTPPRSILGLPRVSMEKLKSSLCASSRGVEPTSRLVTMGEGDHEDTRDCCDVSGRGEACGTPGNPCTCSGV